MIASEPNLADERGSAVAGMDDQPPLSDAIEVAGIGAVSPAGWGVKALREALESGNPVAPSDLTRPGWGSAMRVRTVPAAHGRSAALAHPRLRRSSPITRFAVGASTEALGFSETEPFSDVESLGIVFCVMTGCVNYSRRFYDEVVREPATASPLFFPETVFNAPSSHLAAILRAGGPNYTIVGDPASFLVGLSVAAGWLLDRRVDSCLVIGAEEMDWIVADGFRHFSRGVVLAEGAGAVHLRRGSGEVGATSRGSVRLHSITDPHHFLRGESRERAARKVTAELPAPASRHLLCDGIQDVRRFDQAEEAAWYAWPGTRLSPKRCLGEGLTAAAAWQCVAAIDALQRRQFPAASISVIGCNQQAIGAHFVAVN